MKRIGIGGLVVAAIVLASLSAVSVAAAAGGPEYLGCGKAAKVNKKFTGHYSNKECSTVSPTNEGKYERVAPKFPIKTSSKFGVTTVYLYDPETHKLESEVPCAKGSLKGSINNSREQTLTLTYSGCIIPAVFKNGQKARFQGACNSPGQKPSDIVSHPLATKLVWLNEEETEPGILITPAEPGGTFEEVLCIEGEPKPGPEKSEKLLKVTQTGSLLARIAPEGELTKLLTATFTANELTGEPELSSYWEGGLQAGAGLFSEIVSEALKVDFPAVPTAQTSTIPQKSGKVLID